jgi:hypothetical protein
MRDETGVIFNNKSAFITSKCSFNRRISNRGFIDIRELIKKNLLYSIKSESIDEFKSVFKVSMNRGDGVIKGVNLFLNKKNIIGRDSNIGVIFGRDDRVEFVKNAKHSNDNFVVVLVIREINGEFAIRELFKIEKRFIRDTRV